jgi:prolyl oligopeptidase
MNRLFKFSFALMILTLLHACSSQKVTPVDTLNYPQTVKGSQTDTYFGVTVADPYRWLEDDRSPETEQWVKSQNELTYAYLNQIPYRETLKKRLAELWNYEKISAPFKKGQIHLLL